MADQKPWSDMDKDLRDQVDGIMDLKMTFSEEDLTLFPQLKVYTRLFVQAHLSNHTCPELYEWVLVTMYWTGRRWQSEE